MKKLMIMAALCGCIATAATAQEATKGKPEPKQRAERQTEMMSKNLNLTEEQKAKVAEINLSTAQEIREKGRDNKEQRTAVMVKRDERLKAILTPDQLGKYEEMQTRRAEMMKQRKEAMQQRQDAVK